MMHPDPSTVRLHGRDGLLAAIPAQLGFHPADSAVVVALAGTRRRVGPIARADLPTVPTTAETATLVATLAETVAPFADDAALIIYTDQSEKLDLKTAAKPLMALCPLIDATIVSNRPHDIPADLMAATIGSGRRVLASRQELAQSVQYQPGRGEQPAAMAAFDTPVMRDEFIKAAIGRPEVLPALIAAAQTTPQDDPRLPNLCATLAFLAYRHGDGGLAHVALDRALSANPHHRLASRLNMVIGSGIPPQALTDIVF